MRFNPLEHAITFVPTRWLSKSAWLEHTPFAMLLIDLTRPKILVELGTYTGVSYCAFCQAVTALKLPTRCFAIDTWSGPSGVYTRLHDYHQPLYGSFSTLVKKTFDQAVDDFEDGSIDLLHIDGLHTYQAVRHDFETWKPKLSEAAIVLFHDTAEKKRGDDFGVHQLWSELSQQYPSFEFRHGHGLGVLAVGSNVPPRAIEFIQDASANPAAFRQMFAALGARDSLKPLQAVASVVKNFPVISVANYFADKPGLEILRPGSSYSRRLPRIINAHLTTELIRAKYRSLAGNTPDEGVATFKDAIVFQRGSILTRDKKLIYESVESDKYFQIFKFNPLSPPAQVLDKAITFCKVGSGNYGHFLVEMLPRLILNRASLPEDAKILIYDCAVPFAFPILELAGFDLKRFVEINAKPVRVKELYWPTRNSVHPFNTSHYAITALQDLRDRVVGPVASRGRKLFLSRRDATTRQMVNDAEVFSKLEPLGFEWVEPGKMTFVDQMKTFSECETVVGVFGASLTNLVFMPQNSRVIMLNPATAPGLWFWDLAHLTGLDFTVVFGASLTPKINDKNVNFSVKPDDVMQALATS